MKIEPGTGVAGGGGPWVAVAEAGAVAGRGAAVAVGAGGRVVGAGSSALLPQAETINAATKPITKSRGTPFAIRLNPFMHQRTTALTQE